ncbi:MAG: primosomal protein N' [Chloroflexi bacterium]|nr:primosomal protein N' [Chloroflexota bacterium]
MTRYAEVAVDAPVGHSRTFSYSIPESIRIEPGQLIWVPFGRRILQGVVMELVPAPSVEVTRDILQAIEPGRLLDDTALALARWIASYYLCSLYDALALFLPPGFKGQVRSRILPLAVDVPDAQALKPASKEALAALAEQGRMSEAEFARLLGRAGIREVNRLVDRGFVHRRVDLPRPRTFRYDSRLFPTGLPDALGNWPELSVRVSARQENLLQTVREAGNGYSTTLANREFGPGVGDALVEKGLAGLEWVRQESRSVEGGGVPGEGAESWPAAEVPPVLNPDQAAALRAVEESLANPSWQPGTFLLHGVTGSGKTEVYLRAIERTVALGRQALFLVPEISLTPQTVQRVNARFPGRVAVTHSGLTDRQRFDQWWQIRDGDYDVVVGPRSALFAPLPRLGLIVIDEEHEWTYKQAEAQPYYHARTAARELARRTGATVLMGSATPDIETYYHALQGNHKLLELPSRIPFGIRPDGGQGSGQSGETGEGSDLTDTGDSIDTADTGDTGDSTNAGGLARVEIADMRQELRQGNRSIFSRALAEGLSQCIERGEQAILFLNQRGSAPIVQCRDCGYVVTCSSCSATLTYHASESRLRCHRCNRRSRTPDICRRCQGRHIRQLGVGTQRVVDEVKTDFPGAVVERWDSDAARSGMDPDETMRRLAGGEVQVLVGTQMVAKGLDLPNVTLVGVILADVGIYRPDFRAGERAFGLLCQVAGRAGRGARPGRVIIQTYNPDHYAVTAAANQDYASLARAEIITRRRQGNPPFNQLVRLLYQDSNPTTCQRQATVAARLMRERIRSQGLTDVSVLGPAPGIPPRIRGRYRWNVLLRGRNLHRFLEGLDLPARDATIDVDPVDLL